MDDTIYKAMPVLNTLGINVNQYAPDNNALQFAKAITKIGAGIVEQKKTSEFNSKVAQINQLESKFKNEVLVNKDVDLQDPVKREEIFKKANEITELQKQTILDYKYLDSNDIQKLEGLLYKHTGERAFDLQNDTNKIMIKQAIDGAISNNQEMFAYIEGSGRNADKSEYYAAVFSNIDIMKTNGEMDKGLYKTVFDELVKAESFGEKTYLSEKLLNKNIKYNQIITEFESWKKEVTSDEYLEKKASDMVKEFKGSEEQKQATKDYLKYSLKSTYEKMIMEQTPYVMQQFATEQERQLQQERFEKQYALDAERLTYEKRRDEEYKVQQAIDRGDTLGALSLANGYNTTMSDIFVGNNFSRVTGGITLDKAIANNQTINVFSNEKLTALRNAKKISYDSGKGLPDFFHTNLKSEIDSLPNGQAKEMYIRNLDAQGLIPYRISRMYLNNDPDFNRAMQSLTMIETQTGGVKNRIDVSYMNNNQFKENFTKYGLDNQQQQYLTDSITAWSNTGLLPRGVIINNGQNFARNVRDAYISNTEFRNMVDSEARLIKKYGSKSSFRVLSISQDLVNQAGNNAANNAVSEKAYINRSNGSRANPGKVEILRKNNNSGKTTKTQKTTTNSGKKINYFNNSR